MKRLSIFLFAGLAMLAVPVAANAEDVVVRRSTAVRATPGEQGSVVTRVREGMEMSVLEKNGRWLKVRVNGRTGWLKSSSVKSAQARTPLPKKRRRAFVQGRSKSRNKSKRRAPSDRVGADAVDDDFDEGFDDEEVDEVEEQAAEDDFDEDEDLDEEGFDDEGLDDEEEEEKVDARPTVVAVAKARLRSKPSAKAKSVARAKSGDSLFVIEKKGSWIHVENEDGEEGWLRSSDVEAEKQPFGYKKYNPRVYGALGYSAFAQNFATPNDCDLCNYTLATGAMAVALGGEVIHDYSKEYLLAADVHYRYTRANPGIRFVDRANNQVSDISFQAHQVDLGGRLGYKLNRKMGMAAYGRVGFHYNNFGIDDYKNFEVNLPKLPSEILSGFTVGAMFDVPQFNPKLGFRVGGDMLMGGKRVQTEGLEDGAVSTAKAFWVNARVDYQWKSNTKFTGQYRFSQMNTEWVGMNETSLRDHQADTATRKDIVHAMFVGLSQSL